MQRMSTICRRFSSLVLNSELTATQARWKHTAPENSQATEETPSAQFSGHIPIDELQFSYSRSGGPGGQHVNKVNSKVEVRFHVASASWIPEDVKRKLMEMQSNRITKEGYLVLNSERTRKQLLNQADVMDKLRTMIFNAAFKPRGLTDEEIQLRDKRLGKAKDITLREKRNSSLKKQTRGSL